MIELLLFYTVSFMVLILSCVVAFVQHPVRQILSLIGVFVLMSLLWLLMQAEFLALLLIFVYVGAVMTLFLYMVMMFNSDKIAENKKPFFWVAYVIYAFFAVCGLLLLKSFLPSKHLAMGVFYGVGTDTHFSLKEIGRILFVEHWLDFEVLGLLLLVTMIGCIHLVFRGQTKNKKRQRVASQMRVTKINRLKIIPGEDAK